MTLAQLTACGHVRITLELTPEAAAGLKRFADKVSHEQAQSVLYSHVAAEIRSDQAYAILHAFSTIESALDDAGVTSWPWIDTGRA